MSLDLPLASASAPHQAVQSSSMTADRGESVEDTVTSLAEDTAMPSMTGDRPDALEPPAKRIRPSFDCDDCGTSYTERRTLVRHYSTPGHCVNVGKPVPLYVCVLEGCNKTFARDDIRKRHEDRCHAVRDLPDIQEADAEAPSGHGDEAEIQDDGPESWPRSIPDTLQDVADSSTVGEHGLAVELSTLDRNDNTRYPSGESFGQARDASSAPIDGSDMDLSDQSSGQSHGGHSTNMSHDSTPATSEASSTTTSITSVNRALHCDSVEALERSRDAQSVRSKSTTGSFGAMFQLPIRSRSSLTRLGASLRPKKSKPVLFCPLCHAMWGRNVRDIGDHVRTHIQELKGEHVCFDCDIGFVHTQDLNAHLVHASHNHCGFSFEHQYECSGHHPPGEFDDILSDNGRAQLCNMLRHWEQSQLHALIASVEEATSGQVDNDWWSIGALRSCAQSMYSLNTHVGNISAPDESGYQMRVTFPGTRLVIKAVTDGPKYAARTMKQRRNDNALLNAAYAGDADLIRELIGNGCSQRAMDHATFTALDQGHLPAVRPLFKFGARPDPTPLDSTSRLDSKAVQLSAWSKLLESAVTQGRAEDVRMLLDWGMPVRTPVGEQSESLLYAVADSNFEIARAFLVRGAEYGVETAVIDGYRVACPLCSAKAAGRGTVHDAYEVEVSEQHASCANARRRCAQWYAAMTYLFQGENFDRANWGQLLEYALERNSTTKLQMLFDRGVDIETPVRNHPTALFYAVASKRTWAVHMLVTKGASPLLDLTYIGGTDHECASCMALKGRHGDITAVLISSVEKLPFGSLRKRCPRCRIELGYRTARPDDRSQEVPRIGGEWGDSWLGEEAR